MSTKKELLSQYEKCEKADNILGNELEKLSVMASDVLKCDVVACICTGGEIEFRYSDDGVLDDSESCIRIEDVLRKIKE